MIITVYSELADDVQKRLERLAKKAQKYSVSFAFSRSEEHPQKVDVYSYDEANHSRYVSDTYTVSAVDFNIEADGLIKANGWETIAHIEHGGEGNIVTAIGSAKIDPTWYSAKPYCDHCHTVRSRLCTYIVQNESGDRKQVGKSCLKEYTGIRPETAAIWAEIRELAPGMDCSEEEFIERGYAPMFSTELVLAYACDFIDKEGYIPVSKPHCTADSVRSALYDNVPPSADSTAKAKVLVDWLIQRKKDSDAFYAESDRLYDLAFEETDNSGWGVVKDEAAHKAWLAHDSAWDRPDGLEQNCFPLAASHFAKGKHVSRLAYIPVAYKRYMERKARAEARAAETAAAAASSSTCALVFTIT